MSDGEKPLVVVFALFTFLYLPPYTHISMKFFSLQELHEDNTCLEPVTLSGDSSLPIRSKYQYLPQGLYLRLKPRQTRMGLESQFGTRSAGSCVCSKSHGSNEEPSTHNVSIPIPPTVLPTLPHERSMLRLISPGHQSSVSPRALAPSYSSARRSKSPGSHQFPSVSETALTQQSPGVQAASQPARRGGSIPQSDLMYVCPHIIEISVLAECSGSCRLSFKPGNPCHCGACSLP